MAIGVGVAAVAAFLLPAVRPVARAVLKSGLVCFEKSRELVAEAGEAFEDLVAEVKVERLHAVAAEHGIDAVAEDATPNE